MAQISRDPPGDTGAARLRPAALRANGGTAPAPAASAAEWGVSTSGCAVKTAAAKDSRVRLIDSQSTDQGGIQNSVGRPRPTRSLLKRAGACHSRTNCARRIPETLIRSRLFDRERNASPVQRRARRTGQKRRRRPVPRRIGRSPWRPRAPPAALYCGKARIRRVGSDLKGRRAPGLATCDTDLSGRTFTRTSCLRAFRQATPCGRSGIDGVARTLQPGAPGWGAPLNYPRRQTGDPYTAG